MTKGQLRPRNRQITGSPSRIDPDELAFHGPIWATYETISGTKLPFLVTKVK
jgi:hypothetical protein